MTRAEQPPKSKPFGVTSTVEDEWLAVFHLRGEFDSYSTPEFQQAFIDALETGIRWFLIDLLEVEYIDGTFFNELIGCAKKAEDHSGALAVVCDHPKLMKVFEISGAKEFLNVCPTEADARSLLTARRASISLKRSAKNSAP